MGRKVKQLKSYTTEQVEVLFERDEDYRTGVKLYTILQLTRGYSSRALEEFFRTGRPRQNRKTFDCRYAGFCPGIYREGFR